MLTRAELTAAIQGGRRPKFLFFWGHQPKTNSDVDASCLSQWFPSTFVVDGNTYSTAEHYMMAEKARLFDDVEMRRRIIAAESPATAKKLGRQVRNFDNDIWQAQRCSLVVSGNVEKFRQHPALAKFLIATGERVLVEASPRDRIWGIGLGAQNERATNPAAWRGHNLLGFCLMEVRAQLKGS